MFVHRRITLACAVARPGRGAGLRAGHAGHRPAAAHRVVARPVVREVETAAATPPSRSCSPARPC